MSIQLNLAHVPDTKTNKAIVTRLNLSPIFINLDNFNKFEISPIIGVAVILFMVRLEFLVSHEATGK